MPKSFNPYDDWLGLGSKTTNPNYFRLLKVDPSISDREELKTAVEKGVNRNLALLAKVPPGSYDQVVAQLKRRIQTAQDTLLDPKKRKSYVDRIRSNAKKRPGTQRFKVDSDLDPSIGASSGTSPLPRPSNDRPIPKAIPLAKPIQSTRQDTRPPAPDTRAKQVASEFDVTVDRQTNVGPSEFSITTASRRKRRRPAARIVLGAAALLMASLAFLVYYNFDSLLVLGGVTRLNQPDENSSNESKLTETIPPESLPPTDAPFGVEEFPLDVAAEENQINEVNPPSAPLSQDESGTTQPTEPELIPLSDSQRVLFRRSIERAKRCLIRQDVGLARIETNNARKILGPMNSPQSRAQDRKPLMKLVESTNDLADAIEAFWEQVASNCQTIPGGQEIVFNDHILAFVEAGLNQITLRSKGINITVPFQSLPPGLAIILANQGAIDDVAIWSIQQAALLAASRTGRESSTRIDGLLTVAETFGHDCSTIRYFIDFEFDDTGPPAKRQLLSSKRREELIQSVREEKGYRSPDSLSQKMAEDVFEFLFHWRPDSGEIQAAIWHEAVQVAIRSGDATRVEDAVIEWTRHSLIDQTREFGDALSQLTEFDLNEAQAHALLETAIPFLKLDFDKDATPSTERALANQLKQLATQYPILDSIQRLKQLENRLAEGDND